MAKNLSEYLREIEEKYPGELIRVKRELDPTKFEVTALLQHLENRKQFPMIQFENPLNSKGQRAGMSLLSNVFASRERCAVALGLPPEKSGTELSLLYAEKEKTLIDPILLNKKDSPVKEVVKRGKNVDLLEYPIVRHHEMDPAPYINMTVLVKDPERNHYNISFQRTMLQGSKQLGIQMGYYHNYAIAQKYHAKKEVIPLIIVVGHHPAFYLGSLNILPFGVNDYEVLGGFMGEPLRLCPSETWGDKFLVPADAEMVVEGEMIPWECQAEAPFGEFTGYYGPQRNFPIIRVRAITQRKDPIFQHVFVGHRDVSILGGIPKEGGLLNVIKGIVPTAKAVYFPPSGQCRFYAFISIKKTHEGAPKQAALAALANCPFIKYCVVVDEDVDAFNEEEVWWAVATRTQPSEDLDLLRNVKGPELDPSQTTEDTISKLIIDATVPLSRPFAPRLNIPEDVMSKIHPEDYIDTQSNQKVRGNAVRTSRKRNAISV
jgi:2,5-furandicarboxylate decarboxylase 1